MTKQITISGDSKADLLEEALSVVEMLSGAPAPASEETESEAPPKRGATKKRSSKKVSKKAGPTKDQLRDAVQEAIDTHGEDPVKEVFKKHKAKKFSDFKDSQFAAVLADLKVLEDLAAEDEDEDGGLDLD